MAAVYRHMPLRVGHGGPDAQIGPHDAAVRFPAPYDQAGRISEDCRRWIIESVADAAVKLGLRMCVAFSDDDIVYLQSDGKSFAGERAPLGGLWI